MRNIVCKSSIIIPITVIFYMLSEPVALYICEVNLYLTYPAVLCGFVGLSILWLCCSPLRKSCCNGRWTEVLFNLVPIEVLSLLIFAQWHFVLAVLMVALLIGAETACMILLKKDEGRYRYTVRRHKQYKNVFRRLTVLAMAVICAFPCFMAIVRYNFKSPVYMAEQKIAEILFSEAEEPKQGESDDPYERNINLLRCFEESAWAGYTVQEKITAVQGLVDFQAELLGIPTVQVTAQVFDTDVTLGEYDNEAKEMTINTQHLAESAAEECVRTVCHESYHSLQDYIIENVDLESAGMQSAYFDELRAWKNNSEEYKQPYLHGYDAYAEQPLEASARAYAEEETERIFSYILSDDDE